MTTEFYGLEPGGLLPTSALKQLDTARMGLIAAGRPDIPATTPYTSAELAAMPSGMRYHSTDGPQGAWAWQKRGTTWTVTDGDTGWRSLPVVAPWVGQVYIKRVGYHVWVGCNNLAAGEGGVPSGTDIFGSLQGFNPAPGAGFGITPTRSGGDGSTTRILQHLTMYGPTLPVGHALRFTSNWPTHHGWPTTLPGTAA